MIVLVGFMGSGKTAVGRALAQKLGLPFVDTDALIEARLGTSVADIFSAQGEAAFRAVESDVVAEILAGDDAVVALGGGALGDPVTCSALEWATVVHLDVAFGEALRRAGDAATRPLLATGDPKALYAQRRPVYERVADFSLSTDSRSAGAVADELASRFGGAPRPDEGFRRISVPVPGHPYEVVVGRGVSARVGELIPGLDDAEVAVVVTHPGLQDLAEPVAASLRPRELKVHVALVPEGEKSKSLDAAAALYEELAAAGTHRHDVVVAVGGGVVCDLAGFVASTYHRGIASVYVATTLLAQVDAAIGGKTGVNLPVGKNLVGTFHQPRVVACDVAALVGLPEDELRSGLAEVVKYGLIADPDLLDLFEKRAGEIFDRDAALLEDIVARAAEIKAGIVAADEREAGRRAVLNYGHTFGHAIEHASGLGDVRHGEAISLGMMIAAHLARDLDRIDDAAVDVHRRVLSALGLPVSARLDVEELERAWLHDKKYRRGVRFVLLSALGRAEAGIDAPRDAVVRAVEKVGT